MPPLDQHLFSFIIRCIHVISMTLLLGGAILCWGASRAGTAASEEHRRLLAFVTQRYELFFWTAIGIQLITGIGNLGVFGAGLPRPDSPWGAKMTLKLFAFLILILASLPRGVLSTRLNTSEPALAFRPSVFRGLYAGTAVFVAGIVVLAVSLSHG